MEKSEKSGSREQREPSGDDDWGGPATRPTIASGVNSEDNLTIRVLLCIRSDTNSLGASEGAAAQRRLTLDIPFSLVRRNDACMVERTAAAPRRQPAIDGGDNKIIAMPVF
jgi:hypothetical protein